MAIALPAPTQVQAAAKTVLAEQILRFLSSIWLIGSVQKVQYTISGGQLDIWILMAHEQLEDAAKIFQLERRLLEVAGDVPLDVHVVPLDKVKEENLPPAQILFAR